MSLAARLVRGALQTAVRPVLHPRTPVAVQRVVVGLGSRAPLPRGTTLTRPALGGRPSERLQAGGADGPGAVLLLHGGAFLLGPLVTHRAFAAHLSSATGRPVHVLDYRLAPEHTHPAAVDDAQAAYEELVAGGPVTLVGDSAGGCLALLLALRLRGTHLPAPDALGLVSPVADLTLERAARWSGHDPLLQLSWLRQGYTAYLGGADAAALSPLSADLSGLPPVVLHVSGQERLRPEGEELGRRLAAAGVAVQTHLLDGLWHDVHLQAAVVPEAAQAVRALGEALARVRR